MVSSACRTFPPSSLEAPRPKIPSAVFVALVDWSVAPPPEISCTDGMNLWEFSGVHVILTTGPLG